MQGTVGYGIRIIVVEDSNLGENIVAPPIPDVDYSNVAALRPSSSQHDHSPHHDNKRSEETLSHSRTPIRGSESPAVNGAFATAAGSIPANKRLHMLCRCVPLRLVKSWAVHTCRRLKTGFYAGEAVRTWTLIGIHGPDRWRSVGAKLEISDNVTTSKSIAGLVGPTLVAGAVAVFLNLGAWPALVEQAFRDPALIFVSGFPLFVAGLAIVRAHNRWEGSWPVVVTLVGWLTLLSGLSRILFPTQIASIAIGAVQITGVLPAVAVVILVVGAFLSFKGYSRK